MSPDEWRRVRDAFHEAHGLEPDRREPLLAARLGDAPALLEAARSLLAGSDLDEDDPLDHPVASVREALTSTHPGERSEDDGDRTRGGGEALLGRTIGDCVLESIIGQGGMGVVFRARQLGTGRDVAMKVMRSPMASRGQVLRFQQEAEVLGRLRHRGIAQVHRAGVFDFGLGEQPYLVMEFIDGRPLTAAAAAMGLGLADRLRLVGAIAEAVQHAHQKGIVHRDLKPSNVLVTAAGEPKILDFGIARVMRETADGNAGEPHTVTGQVLGTVQYMSPEQLRGRSIDVDTRSDVYTLGVMLYELLTGSLPYLASSDETFDVAHAVLEGSILRLGAHDRRFRGDLELLVGHAMAHEREDRYPSAIDLKRDIDRWLEQRPLEIRRDARWYVAGKFVRRHWKAVTVLAAAMIGLVTATTVIAVLNRQVRTARASELATVGALGPIVQTAGEWTSDHYTDLAIPREQLLPFGDRLEDVFREQPRALASFNFLVASGLLKLGDRADLPRARVHLEVAARLFEELSDGPSTRRAMVLRDLGKLEYRVGDFEASERRYAEAIDAIGATMRGRGLVEHAPDPDGDRVETAFELLAALPDPSGWDRTWAARGVLEDALNAILVCRQKVLPMDAGADWSLAMGELFDRHRRLEAARAEAWGPAAPRTLASSQAILGLLVDLDRHAEGAVLGASLLERLEGIPLNERYVPRTRRKLARCLLEIGRAEEAAAVLEASAEAGSAGTEQTLVEALASLERGRPGEARERLSDLLASVDGPGGPADEDLAAALVIDAEALLRTGDLEAFADRHEELAPVVDRMAGRMRWRFAAEHARLGAELALRRDEPAAAIERAKAARDLLADHASPTSPTAGRVLLIEADGLAAMDRSVEAVERYREALEFMQAAGFARDHWRWRHATVALVRLGESEIRTREDDR